MFGEYLNIINMKKITLLFMLLAGLTINAQRKVDEYSSEYFNKTYNIEASLDKKEGFDLYIGIASESVSSEARIMLKSRDLELFIKALIDTKNKYYEWSKIAKENNVDKLNKEIDVKFPSVDIAWLGSKWFFSFNQKLKPKFSILESGKHVVMFYNNNVSSSNQFIKETTYWVFSDATEFDEIISKLSFDTIKSKLDEEENKKELFK